MSSTYHYHDDVSLNWSSAAMAGVIAGLVFLMAEMGMLMAMGESPWGPPRMMAAIFMGKGVLPPPATFDFGVVMMAMVVHFVLSLILAFGFTPLITGRGMAASLAAGAVFGLVVYLVNFYGFTAIFPWFAMARTPVTIGSHILFGLVLAWSYKALARPQ